MENHKKLIKEIITASLGHISENQTFVSKPVKETENITTVDDLKDNKKK